MTTKMIEVRISITHQASAESSAFGECGASGASWKAVADPGAANTVSRARPRARRRVDLGVPGKAAPFYARRPADAFTGPGRRRGPTYTRRALATLRKSKSSSLLGTAVRLGAAGAVAAGFAVPGLRRRFGIPTSATVAATAAAPIGLAILFPRSKTRDAALFALQMWAFGVAHELPYDDPDRLRARLRIRYPIRADRLLGAGVLPNTRLQRTLARPRAEISGLDRFLTLTHWVWFFEPHVSLLFILASDEQSFARAARQMSAAYDLGCATYFALPTAPPWWAAEHGYTGDDEVERRMTRVGEEVWGETTWARLYELFGGNPWAAMPSLHFGASVLAADPARRDQPLRRRRRLGLRRHARRRARLSRRALRHRSARRPAARRGRARW